MKPIAVILWLWFLVAVGVYIWRGVRWMQRRAEGTAEPKPTRHERRAEQLDQLAKASEGPTPTQRLFQEVLAERDGTGAATGGATDAAALERATAPTTGAGGEVSIATLLTGMDWPCDLAPVIDAEATDLDRRVAFSTATHDAQTVRTALRAALEALGYEVVDVDDRTMVAVGARGRLATTLHPDVTSWGGGIARAPLPTGSVVVELSVRT